MNIQRLVALQHHVVCIERGHLESAIVSGNAAINGLCQDACPFRVGMDGIRQQVRIRIEGCMKIDEFCPTHPSHHLDGFLYLIVPLLGARNESGMAVGYRRHASQDKAYLRIGRTQRVHQRQIVLYKFISIVRPVSRVGIVDAQVDDGDVALEGHRLLILFLLHIRTVAVVQQGGTRFSEVAYQIFVAQHFLQLYGIGEMLSILDSRAIGDTVAHASHLDFLHSFLSGSPNREGAREEHRQHQGRQCSLWIH